MRPLLDETLRHSLVTSVLKPAALQSVMLLLTLLKMNRNSLPLIKMQDVHRLAGPQTPDCQSISAGSTFSAASAGKQSATTDFHAKETSELWRDHGQKQRFHLPLNLITN